MCSAFFGTLALFVLLLPALSSAQAVDRAALQAQLDELNKEIADNQTQLASEQAKRTSLERDVSILDYKIQQAQLEIKRRNVNIAQIKAGIVDKQNGIESLDNDVAKGQASLAHILRQTRVIDDMSLAQLALSGSFSDLFNEVSTFEVVQRALGESFTTMAAERSDLSARKSALQEQQQEEQDLLQLQELQQQSLKATEKQKEDLVTASKGQESIYMQIIANKQQSAAQIKNELFSLAGGTNTSTSFGDMYSYAKQASVATGVDAAFILAILTEESNLGQNVGNCTYENAMSPTRDIPKYLSIMQQLGLDPDSKKVSCAQSYGSYGGAMGPAQFIPSTWVLYQARIASATGQNPPNPWDPRTATFATAIYMSDLGADAGTAASERQAALRYLAGSHWQNPAYAFYWESVQSYMQQYQSNISILNGS